MLIFLNINTNSQFEGIKPKYLQNELQRSQFRIGNAFSIALLPKTYMGSLDMAKVPQVLNYTMK